MVLADTFYALWQESQAKVADLERQLDEARQWTPVEDGERIMCACGNADCWRSIRARDTILEMFENVSDVENESHWGVIDLPDNIRLCRQKSLICSTCGGTGEVDSGALDPNMGIEIRIPCPECAKEPDHV